MCCGGVALVFLGFTRMFQLVKLSNIIPQRTPKHLHSKQNGNSNLAAKGDAEPWVSSLLDLT